MWRVFRFIDWNFHTKFKHACIFKVQQLHELTHVLCVSYRFFPSKILPTTTKKVVKLIGLPRVIRSRFITRPMSKRWSNKKRKCWWRQDNGGWTDRRRMVGARVFWKWNPSSLWEPRGPASRGRFAHRCNSCTYGNVNEL